MVLTTGLAFGLGACGNSSEKPAESMPSATTGTGTTNTDKTAGQSVVIDVRTPEEYAEGHLGGATNLDVYDPAFMDKVAKLDRANPYVLYCRSGKRAEQAASMMRKAGFKDVTSAGGVEEASQKLGRDVVAGN